MFQPEPEILERIIESLGSLTDTSFRTQALAKSKLKSLHESLTNFSSYLSLIMVTDSLTDNIRTTASQQLSAEFKPDNIILETDYIKKNLLIAFSDPLFEKSIVHVISNVIRYHGLEAWPELWPKILKANCLPSTMLLEYICTSSVSRNLSHEIRLEVITYCMNNIKTDNKKNANLINIVIHLGTSQETKVMSVFMSKLVQICKTKMRIDLYEDICTFILFLCEKNIFSAVNDNLSEVLEFLLKCASQNNAELIDCAAECWESFDITGNENLYVDFLTSLIKILYEQIHKVKTCPKHLEEDIYDVFDKDIRRSAVDALEFIARLHGSLVCKVVLPLINENLESTDSLVKESAILALGVLAQSNSKEIGDFFHNHSIFLMNLLEQSEPIIQMTTLWTLSKYFGLIVSKEDQVKEMLEKIIKLMNTKDDQIHHATLSLLLAVLEVLSNQQTDEMSFFQTPQQPVNVEPFFEFYERLLEAIWRGMHLYKEKLTISNLYDVIAGLFDFVKTQRDIPSSKWIEMMFLEMLDSVSSMHLDEDASYCLGSLAALSSCYPDVFVLHSAHVVNICTHIIESFFDDVNYRDVVISCLDFLSEVVQHMEISPLNKRFFVTYTFKCLDSEDLTVSQSGFGLLGELMKQDAFSFELEEIFPHIERSIEDFENFSNNAIWAFGEIATKRDDSALVTRYTKKFIPKILEKLMSTVNGHLRETICMTLGKIAVCLPKEISTYVPGFLDVWCSTLLNSMETRNVQSDVDALNRALVLFAKNHHSAIIRNIPKICTMIKMDAWRSRFNIEVLIELFKLKKTNKDIEAILKQNYIEFQPVVRLFLLRHNLINANFSDVVIKFTC